MPSFFHVEDGRYRLWSYEPLPVATGDEPEERDAAIARLAADPQCDELQLKRMKKRKLTLKDAIAKLESKLIPDLDA